MPKLEFATYKLPPESASRVQEAANLTTGQTVAFRKLSGVEGLKAFTKPTEPATCRLLVVHGDDIGSVASDLDLNQPLAILQLRDSAPDIDYASASLETIYAVVPSCADVNRLSSVLRRAIYDVATGWERLARHQIQSESEAAHLLVARAFLKTSPFLDSFVSKVQQITQASSLGLGYCDKSTDKITIIHQSGTRCLTDANLHAHLRSLEFQDRIETQFVSIDEAANTAITSTFIDARAIPVFVLFEFESDLPTRTLSDICYAASRDLRGLHGYCIAKARSDCMKVLADTQLLLPNKNRLLQKVLQHLKDFFDADGASILLVSRHDEPYLDFEKMFIHHGRFEKDKLLKVDHGYAYHCVTSRVALLIERTQDPPHKGDGIGFGTVYDINRFLHQDKGQSVAVKYIRAPRTIEDEKSLMVFPIVNTNHEDEIVGVLKIGNFATPGAFTFPQMLDLRIFARAVSILLHGVEIAEYLEQERTLRAEQRKMATHAEQLFFWREIALGVFHQIANYLNEADNKMLLSETLCGTVRYNTEAVERTLAEARNSVHLGKKLLRETRKRGEKLNPVLAEYYLVKDIVQPAVEHVNKYLRSRRWEITHSYRDRDYVVNLDAALARESIINILNNAVWAVTHDRRITKKKVFVAVRQLKYEEYVKIEIQDSGIGVLPQLMPMLFTPFFTTREGGTGLGLYFAKRIMQYFGGDVEIPRTRPLKGTTVVITLPILEIKKGQ